MRYQIIDKSTLGKASGLVVVIDVLRAFTTACYIFSKNAHKIILINTPEEGLLLKEKIPDYILVGERQGAKIPGYDYGNSPHELNNINLLNKTVVMTTTQGTACFYELRRLNSNQEMITGSFVNASAVIKYIQKNKFKLVSFVCTDNSSFDNEDYMCAKFLISCLRENPLDFKKIRKDLIKHPLAEEFLRRPLTEFASADFRMCLQLNKFSFIIAANTSSEHIILEKIKL